MRTSKIALQAAFCLLMTAAACLRAAGADPEVFPLSQVKPGMKGVGKTVLAATAISEFPFEVIDVMKNWLPGQDVILVRCGGREIEKSGIASGMSGSPCFIDGKLMGALAYAWSWSKEPLAGITPIEYMLEAGRRPLEKKVEAPAGYARGPLTPIQAPLFVSARSERAVQAFGDIFAGHNLKAIGAGNSGGAFKDLDAKMEPGAAVAVVLMDGDMEAYASGTVTCVAGGKIYAFGHPFLGEGEYTLPVANCYTYGVVPSAQMAFKISAAGRTLGALIQDRQSCIVAKEGDAPPMIPLTMTIRNAAVDKTATFNVRIARHRAYTPMIASMALSDALASAEPGPGQMTQLVTLTFKPVGRDEASVTMYYSTEGSFWGVNFMQPLSAFLNNRFEQTWVEWIKVDAEIVHEGRTGKLTGLSVPRSGYFPGETVEFRVEVTPYRKEPFWVTVPFRIPDETEPGKWTLSVAPADEVPMDEESPLIESMETLLAAMKAVNSARADRLVAYLKRPGFLLQHKGKRYGDLPASALFGLLPEIESGGFRATPRFWKSDPVQTGLFLAGNQSAEITIKEKRK